MGRSITIKLEGEVLERAERMAEKYNVSIHKMVKDTIENFAPYTDVPDDFIIKSGLSHVLKKDIPLRSILPFTSSMLGLNMVSDFTIVINGVERYINPYPERSTFCIIKMFERLYQVTQMIEETEDSQVMTLADGRKLNMRKHK